MDSGGDDTLVSVPLGKPVRDEDVALMSEHPTYRSMKAIDRNEKQHDNARDKGTYQLALIIQPP